MVRFRRLVVTASLAGAAVGVASLAGAAERDSDLVAAVRAGDDAAAFALLDSGAAADAAEADGTTALHWAAYNDDLDLVNRLLAAGAGVGVENRYGVTPLYLAAVNGNAGMIDRFLAAGADANAVTREGETALMTAARTGRVEAVRALLAHGATVDARETWRGQTALMWAAAQNHPEVVRELLAAGADVNVRSALQNWERQSTSEPRQKWLALGALTPLLFAARQGSLESTRLLVEAGADLDATDPLGVGGVVTAIINGHYDVAAFLIEAGSDPNLADEDGRTPLYAAADMHTMPVSNVPMPNVLEDRSSALDLIELLIARGADPNVQLVRQQPYRAKLDRGNDTVLTTGSTPLLRAAKAGDVAAVQRLLAQGADPRLTTSRGTTAVMLAAGLGTREEDTTGRSKTEAEAVETIRALLDAGVDVNAADSQGQTALHGAALQGYDRVVRYLAERGASLDVADDRGHTPLDAARGQAGGFGFGGQSGVVRESTAALLEELLTGRAAGE